MKRDSDPAEDANPEAGMTTGDWLTLGGGIALVATNSLPWATGFGFDSSPGGTVTAVAFMGLGISALSTIQQQSRSALILVLAVFSEAATVYEWGNVPSGYEPGIGLYVALTASGLAAVGAVIALLNGRDSDN